MTAIFLVPVLFPFYKDILGFGFSELFWSEAIFSVALVIFEVPSGWLSDVWKRRNVLFLSPLFIIVAIMITINAKNFWMIALAQTIWGLGVSFFSGTLQSLLYDHLYERNQQHRSAHHETQRHSWSLISGAVSLVIGGFCYKISPYLPFILCCITLFGAAICAFFMKEPHRHNKKSEFPPLQDMYQTAKFACFEHKIVGSFLLWGSIIFGSTKLIYWLQTPYYEMVKLDVSLYGILMCLGYILGAASGQIFTLYQKISANKKINYVNVLWFCSGSVILTTLFAALWVVPASVFWLLSGSAIYGFGFPVLTNAINEQIDSRRRATILSLLSFFKSLLFIPVSLMIGAFEYIDKQHAVLYGLLTVSGFCLIGSLIAWYQWRRYHTA
jgi:MFS family permease